jgi:diguanylate cyclase (GGDEF)-like protein
MAVAATAVGVEAMVGSFLSPVSFAGAVLCVAMAAVHRWVTARETRRMAARLARSEAYFRSLVRSSGDAVVILDDALRVSWASAALAWTLGPAAPALVGRPLLEAVHPDDAATLAAALPTVSGASPVPGGAPVPAPGTGLLLLRLQDADGVWRYLEAGVSDLRRDADVGAVVLQCRDMTDRHERERALLSVAYTDPLTGLPNRAGFLRGLHQAVSDRASTRMSGPGAGPAADELPATLLMIELDGLADARDHAGREVMTTMVAEIGRRLRATVRGEDLVARLGGGGFAVLTDGGDADADRLASRCLSVVEQPIVTAAGIVDLTARVGVVSLEEGLSVEEALGRADLAVRAAHAAGPGSAARYRPALGEAAARLDRLRTDLQDAAARGQFFLLFQPVVSLQEQRVTGVEALLRWRHPVFGDVEPDEFLPIAERAGLIGELMRWSLQEATAAAAALPAGAAPRIGLNAPTGYVATGTLVADVQAALQRSGLPPERLVLEISAATVMLDDERTGLDMSTLRLMGVHVALDDFGGDRSALAHLTRLPIDIVKLHRSFITRLDRDPQSRALCESVVGIARALGMDVVAQGVETPAQLAALCGVGCDFAQGFLISRPVPLAALVAMLTDGAGSLWPGLVGSR